MDVEVPQPELVDIDRLQLDGDNPNKMKKKQLHAFRKAIQRWGFIVPIVTNRGLLVADGEQRITVAKELGMRQVPVVRLDVEDVDRRLLRQVLNKLKGQHVPELDQEEFLRIIEAGGEEDLKAFLVASDKEINAALSNEEETASRRSIVGGLRELAYALAHRRAGEFNNCVKTGFNPYFMILGQF